MGGNEEGIFRSALAHAQSPLENAQESEGQDKDGEENRDQGEPYRRGTCWDDIIDEEDENNPPENCQREEQCQWSSRIAGDGGSAFL